MFYTIICLLLSLCRAVCGLVVCSIPSVFLLNYLLCGV